MNTKLLSAVIVFSLTVSLLLLSSIAWADDPSIPTSAEPTETFGNNLSFPVLWAEGVEKTLRGAPGAAPVMEGAWWYWWGTDAEGNPLSCAPDPDDTDLCDDGVLGTTSGSPPEANAQQVYLQQDPLNEWQAGIYTETDRVEVSWLDWGDNLESVDWTTRSMVRTEVALIQDLPAPVLEYQMRHLYGWGQTEMWGLSTTGNPPVAETLDGMQATVYSACARLIIQRLQVLRDDPQLATLEWMPTVGWTEPAGSMENLISDPLFNKAVWEAADGPGYYSAEINVKGKIIYGYTWDTRKLNEGAGDYRITFSLDATCGAVALNTFFSDATGTPVTQIVLPEEEGELLLAAAEPDEGGATAVIDYANNLSYIDIRLIDRQGGHAPRILLPMVFNGK